MPPCIEVNAYMPPCIEVGIVDLKYNVKDRMNVSLPFFACYMNLNFINFQDTSLNFVTTGTSHTANSTISDFTHIDVTFYAEEEVYFTIYDGEGVILDENVYSECSNITITRNGYQDYSIS